MMKAILKGFTLCALICIFSLRVFGQQYASKYGWKLPPKGTVKVFYVFAEVVGTCERPNSSWTSSGLPPDADQYLDPTVTSDPSSYISKYYKEMSLSDHNVIGDYYNGVVQIPCSLFTTVTQEGKIIYDVQKSNREVINALNREWKPEPGTTDKYLTFRGLNLNSFDDYSLEVGKEKLPGKPDGLIDAVVILWKNHPHYHCQGGNGIGSSLGGITLKNKKVDVFGSWGHCPRENYDMFLTEYFHVLFGHNNFHTNSGDGSHTFWTVPGSFSMTGQSGKTSQVVCGWDRHFLGIKGSKNFTIGAIDANTGSEVNSDLSIETHPNEYTFILRDFVKVGDAIRIKLPFINWTTSGDTKNQYLWLENHQKVSPFDKNVTDFCSNWAKGIYAYLQVGKDIISDFSEVENIYDGGSAMPNSLGSYLFPLSAEGNYDFYYEYNTKNDSTLTCQWNNKSLPYGKYYPEGEIKPNPFTGFSDLYGAVDINGDDYINSNDNYIPKFQKYNTIPNGIPPAPTLPAFGDELDAFKNIGKILSISTNPAPVPVYTLNSRNGSNISDYENRTIYLNGLSIEILSLDAYGDGKGAIKVKIKWNDYSIDRDSRWCGYIVLRDNPSDPNLRKSEVVVEAGKKLILDKSETPTQNWKSSFPDGSYSFTEPTVLNIEQSTSLTVKDRGQIEIKNGSSLIVKDGSTLKVLGQGKVTVNSDSKICIEQNTLLDLTSNDIGGIEIVTGGSTITHKGDVIPALFSGIPSHFLHENNVYGKITSNGAGLKNPSNVYSKAFKARKSITLTPGFVLDSKNQGSSSFTAMIQPGVQMCSNLFTPKYTTSGTTIVTNPIVGNHPHHGNEFEFNWFYDDHAHEEDKQEETLSIQGEKMAVINIFPNPSKGKIEIKNYSNIEIQNIQVFDAIGKEIHFRKESITKDIQSLNLDFLSDGIYFIVVQTEKNVIQEKVLIKK